MILGNHMKIYVNLNNSMPTGTKNICNYWSRVNCVTILSIRSPSYNPLRILSMFLTFLMVREAFWEFLISGNLTQLVLVMSSLANILAIFKFDFETLAHLIEQQLPLERHFLYNFHFVLLFWNCKLSFRVHLSSKYLGGERVI